MSLHPKHLKAPSIITRRGLLLGGASATAGLITANESLAGIAGRVCVPSGGGYGGDGGNMEYNNNAELPRPISEVGERAAWIYDHRSGATYREVYMRDGAYLPEAIEKYNWFARDWREQTPTNMNPKLLDIYYHLADQLNITRPFNLNSGYRSPKTNASLKGAAKRSQHMLGNANDVSHPQISPSQVHRTCLGLQSKGIVHGLGRYQTFTHFDTRGYKANWG